MCMLSTWALTWKSFTMSANGSCSPMWRKMWQLKRDGNIVILYTQSYMPLFPFICNHIMNTQEETFSAEPNVFSCDSTPKKKISSEVKKKTDTYIGNSHYSSSSSFNALPHSAQLLQNYLVFFFASFHFFSFHFISLDFVSFSFHHFESIIILNFFFLLELTDVTLWDSE